MILNNEIKKNIQSIKEDMESTNESMKTKEQDIITRSGGRKKIPRSKKKKNKKTY